ncbi:hypothetical protein [Litorihabitans aurantiacus]|uniref:Uncharacterized protein n=1 Tax=Litorihabitans aurantiacus TaxID=1930061 RepID=A0AA38CU21_9MICO|nr:hypothetical protein [Litorihabitans aurantiacus]GMA32307.1 hypothetical protein GCM10025875_22990 [Litorihabitans aurantiacus]
MTPTAPSDRTGAPRSGTPSGVVVTALLGLGAAMLLLAAVPGVARDGEGTAASRVLLVAVLLAGLAATAWSLASLRVGRLVLPRTTVAAAFGTTAVGALGYTALQPLLLAALPGVRIPGADDYTTAALLVLTAFGVVVVTRARAVPEYAPAAGAGRRLLALAAGAAVVGALVTPGLAASAAGDYAVPHGEHGSTAAAVPEVDAAPAPAEYLDPARSGRPVPSPHTGH